jgi:hypothetical protein
MRLGSTGSTKINNNFDIVDAVSKEDPQGMTATFFVKSGDEFVRVSTSVPKPDSVQRFRLLTGALLTSDSFACRSQAV